ncbi:arginine--tRNA ligase [Candidatus Pacearchaeota archaeon]|nr:arginine--tRNA ligase [Candidatus Pacearchaeota archaeon]
MKSLIIQTIKKALEKKKIKISDEEIEKHLEAPPSADLGDYAFPCFFLSGIMKQDPKRIALIIRETIGNIPAELEDIQTEGPYVNFFLNRKDLASSVIDTILKQKDAYGKANMGNDKVMIEFSQANTHKAFHVGHIRGTSLGESLARILEFCGNKVIRANYQGDSGMHVAKWIWCYKKYHSREKIKNDESWIASIYVDAVERLAKGEKLQEEVDIVNKSLEGGKNKELVELWKKTRKLSLDAFEKIYKELNTHFDFYFFEKDMEKDATRIVEDLLAKKIAILSDGAAIMDLKKHNLGVWVLLRKDKTVLYSAKDLALAERKFNQYKIDRSIYVVGAEQKLHLHQLFKTLELAGFPQAKKCEYVPVSEVRFPWGKMSSRTGDNVLYSELIKQVADFAKKGIKKRTKKISDKELEGRALKISIAAIKYSMLKQNPNRNIIFKKEEAMNFEGDTGPYLLYSYTRASSILKKSKAKISSKSKNLEQKEIELIKELSKFPEITINAKKALDPSVIANYSYHLAQVFNEFYHSCQVLNSENEAFRVSLVASFEQVLKNSLYLLGIEVLDKM